MRTLFFLSAVFVLLVSSTSNWPFNRLDKLYQKDPDKCLVVSKRYMKLFPSKPEPYYFASKVYFDKASDAKNLRSQYLNLSKALGYAVKFEKYADEITRKQMDWSDYTSSVEEGAKEIMEALEKEGQDDYLANLERKINKIETIQNIELVKTVDTKVEAPTKGENILSGKINGEYFGMPSGMENIPSFSEESEKELLQMINAERKKKGMDELVWEEDLARAARYHAFDMGSQNYFDHNSFDRKDGKLVNVGKTFVRIRTFYNTTFVNSENIAAGNAAAADTYDQWYNSKGHYDNMFNSSSKKVGIGVCHAPGSSYGYYWVFCTAQ